MYRHHGFKLSWSLTGGAERRRGTRTKKLTWHSSGRRQALLFRRRVNAKYFHRKDLCVFDFKTHTWSIETGSGDLPNVKALGTRMVPVGTKLYIFGGRDEHKQFDDFYSYDTVKKEWKFLTKLDEVGGPEARTFHSMAWDDNYWRGYTILEIMIESL